MSSDFKLLSNKYIDLLKEICNIESGSYDKRGIDNVSDFLVNFAKDFGYKIERKSFDNAGDCLCIDYIPNIKKPFIVLSAHMDTVYEKGFFGYPAVRMDDRYIYGPGVCDCKGGIAVALLVMEYLKENGFCDLNIRLLLQSDEEVSSSLSNKKTIEYICDKSKDCVAFLNLEPRYPGEITVERGGIINARLYIIGKNAHSSKKENGANAIFEAAKKICWAQENSATLGLSINFGMIKGGNASNIVPDKCSLDMEIRVKSMENYYAAFDFIKELSEKSFVGGTRTEYSVVSDRIPMVKTDFNVELFERLSKISRRCGMGALAMRSSMGGSDASYTTSAGIPTADGLGIVGYNVHTVDEKAEIGSLSESAYFITEIIKELAKE